MSLVDKSGEGRVMVAEMGESLTREREREREFKRNLEIDRQTDGEADGNEGSVRVSRLLM